MTHQLTDCFSNDRSGRRRIKDRRFQVTVIHGPNRRTGLRRRSGWDRRCQQVAWFKRFDRRQEGSGAV